MVLFDFLALSKPTKRKLFKARLVPMSLGKCRHAPVNSYQRRFKLNVSSWDMFCSFLMEVEAVGHTTLSIKSIEYFEFTLTIS